MKSAERSFRLVCRSKDVSGVEDLLTQEGFEFSELPFFYLARTLHAGPRPLGSSLAARLGFVYIQDRSSMLPPLYLSPESGDVVLDLCASPGSKSGLLAQLMAGQGTVVANEPNRKRLQTLRQNLRLMGLVNVLSSGLRGETFPDRFVFDRILLDVPCSGWGTEEKNPRVRKIWTPERLGPLLALQRRLLLRAWELLKPGGSLVYSTCTTNRAENQDMISWFLDGSAAQLESLEPLPGFVPFVARDCPSECLSGTLQINGPASGGQSFFVAGLRKPGLVRGERLDRVTHNISDLPGGVQALPVDFAWSELPAGELQVRQGCLEFFPVQGAELIRQGLPLGGVCLGRLVRDNFQVSGRARCLLPAIPVPGQSLVVEESRTLQALLSGQSVTWSGRLLPAVGLYFRNLPVGWLRLKGRRLLWSGR